MKTYMPRLNKTEISGRLVKDPELFTTQSKKKVARFTVAVNERFRSGNEYKEKTSFIPVVIWNGFAEKLLPHLKKGTGLVLEGSLNSRDYKTKEGKNRTAIEVIGRRAQVLTRAEVVEHAGDPGHEATSAPHGA